MPCAAETVDALAVRFAPGLVARVVVQRQAAERDLQHPIAAPQDREAPMHSGSGFELGLVRTNGEWRPELQAGAALAQEVTRGLWAQGVERAPLGIDSDLFAEPDRLDLARHPNPHLGFGYGLHYCLGAPLARLETTTGVSRLLDRYARIELAGAQPRWRPNLLGRAVENFEVRLT